MPTAPQQAPAPFDLAGPQSPEQQLIERLGPLLLEGPNPPRPAVALNVLMSLYVHLVRLCPDQRAAASRALAIFSHEFATSGSVQHAPNHTAH